jgi:hypothetical protein
MPVLDLPEDVLAVFDHFRTCELTTFGRAGTPITWPALPLYHPAEGTFLFSTSIGFPQKAYNVRRDAKVALLFSDATGSGLHAAPTVLVQGRATCPDELAPGFEGLDHYARRVLERQPVSRYYDAIPIARRAFGWYYLRLLIHVVPVRIHWWPAGDPSGPSLEVNGVA